MDTALTLENLCLGYGDRTVIRDLSLAVPRGRFTALLGPNGCGKSTLLKSLTCTLGLQGGRVHLDGKDIASYSPRALARKVALLPQSTTAPDGVSVRQLIGYGRSPHNNIWGRLSGDDRKVVDAALARMTLADLADTPVSDLSGGQQQRAWLAMVMAQQTPVILLDEPTTYLDIAHQVEVMKLCQAWAREGRTVIAVLHDLNQAFRYADHIAILRAGRLIAEGGPDKVAQADHMHKAFEIEMTRAQDPESGTPFMVVRDR